jgi:hypothetical protein
MHARLSSTVAAQALLHRQQHQPGPSGVAARLIDAREDAGAG